AGVREEEAARGVGGEVDLGGGGDVGRVVVRVGGHHGGDPRARPRRDRLLQGAEVQARGRGRGHGLGGGDGEHPRRGGGEGRTAGLGVLPVEGSGLGPGEQGDGGDGDRARVVRIEPRLRRRAGGGQRHHGVGDHVLRTAGGVAALDRHL